MANRDFKKIERIMKDFSMGVGEGGGGTTVVANPELEGTEPDLTGLEVEGTKYKVPQGGGGSVSIVELEMPNPFSFGQVYEVGITSEKAEALRTALMVKTNQGELMIRSREDETSFEFVHSLMSQNTGYIINVSINLLTLKATWIGNYLTVQSGS